MLLFYSKYFEYITKKHEIVTDNSAISIYVNKIENKLTFKISTPEAMNLLGSTKNKTNNEKNFEDLFRLQNTEVALVQYNILKNHYWHDSRVLCTFVLNKSFGQLSDISSKNFIFLKTFNSEFSYIELWFTDQSS